MRSGGRAGSRPSRSRRPPNGWRGIGSFGRPTSSASTPCSKSSRTRRERREPIQRERRLPMKNAGTLQVSTPTEREIEMTRVFDAPRNLVFDAWTKPELLKRWLGAMPGWSMPICEIDLKVGGSYRYVWRNDADGTDMGMGGVYRE